MGFIFGLEVGYCDRILQLLNFPEKSCDYHLLPNTYLFTTNIIPTMLPHSPITYADKKALLRCARYKPLNKGIMRNWFKISSTEDTFCFCHINRYKTYYFFVF
jgi:hypothetical protein